MNITVTVLRISGAAGTAASGAPHELQKREPSGFCVAQRAQVIIGSSLPRELLFAAQRDHGYHADMLGRDAIADG
jgi:hypothetical protein